MSDRPPQQEDGPAAGPPGDRPRPSEPAAARPDAGPDAPRHGRPAILLIAAGVAVLMLVAGFVWWRLNAGWVKTDNAQTAGDLMPISSQVSGIVTSIAVHQDEYVKQGAVLVQLDPTPYVVALAQAQAQYQQAEAQVAAAQAALTAQEQLTSTNISAAQAQLAATRPTVPQAQATLSQQQDTVSKDILAAETQVQTAAAALRSQEAQLTVAQRTLARDRELLAQGAVAQQQVDLDTAAEQAAVAQVQNARSALAQTQAQLSTYLAQRQQVVVARQQVVVNQQQVAHAVAMVQQAQAGEATVQQLSKQLEAAEAQAGAAAEAVRTARLNLDDTTIRAPADGWVVSWVTSPTVTLGQVVSPNQPLLWITGQHVWIMTNIKETQLGGIRIGDPVRITIDALRGRVFHGVVASIGSASGSATALLPADNATGNFVKVVQLVPVRIEFTGAAAAGNDGPDPRIPVGVSAEVAIWTAGHGGGR
jgi:membrane fusion protein, multidrug efflux system